MKKISYSLLVTIFVLLFFNISSFGQQTITLPSWANALAKHTVISEFVAKSEIPNNISQTSKEVEGNQVKITHVGGTSQNNTTKGTMINSKDGKIFLTLNLLRIQEKNASLDIDTDSPYPSTPIEKMTTDHFMQFIKNPVVIELNTKEEIIKVTEPKLPIRRFWNGDLPQLYSVKELSGIVQFLPNEGIKIWTDSLKDEKGIYINNYKIIEDKKNTAKINLKGEYIPKKQTNMVATEAKMPQNGETIQTTTTTNAMNYEGEIEVDKNASIIKNMILKINKNNTTSVLGQTITKEIELLLTIVNKVK